MKINVEYNESYSDELEIVIKAKTRSEELNEVIDLLSNKSNHLVGFIDDEYYILDMSKIYYFTIIDNKIICNMNNKILTMKKRIFEIENILKSIDSNFIKINQSTIVNLKWIEKFQLCYNGTIDIFMKNGYRDYVSRRCVKAIKDKLNI